MKTTNDGQATDANTKDLPARVNDVMKAQEIIAVTQAENETEQQKKRQRAELADHRTKLLKAVQVEAPDLAAPLFEKLSALAHENHEFAPREVVDLLKAHKARFKDEPDFFDLGIAQREDLLDRVGFYRGVVIDHTLSNPVEAGFRDVLMRSDDYNDRADREGPQRLRPAHLFYRKPNFSGYFENYYTASESVYQTQKNGVTNLSFSLSAAVGRFANSFALGAALTSYGRQEETSGFVGKTVFTTANFYLPKIELSFDNTEACASKAFCDACERAVKDPELRLSVEQKFKQLKQVLDNFGHFVALQTLVGGRLFATETKLFEGSEKSTDFTERFGVKVKASLSTAAFDVEASGSYEKSNQQADKSKNSREMQSMTFNAIGGEGTVVQDAAAWAESLYDYRRWASVQRENLIPTINLLPKSLYDLCWQVLKDFGQARTKRTLLHDEKAYFLFYGEYGEKIGSQARDAFFSIQNHAYAVAVTVNTMPPSEGVQAALTEPKTASSQLWRMTENGQIILRATDRKTAHGATRDVYFALTAVLPAVPDNPPKDEYPVCLHQLTNSAAQVWDYPGSGELFCHALGAEYVLDAVNAGSLMLIKRQNAGRESHLWYLTELPDYLEKSLDDGHEERWVQIFTPGENTVLTLSNAEHLTYLNDADSHQVVAQPNIGGLHQLWRKEDSGRFVSALPAKVGNTIYDILLSADDNSTSSAVLGRRYTCTEIQYCRNTKVEY